MPLLIFDCDGTLIDSETLVCRTQIELMRELFGVDYDLHTFDQRFLGVSSNQVYQALEVDVGQPLPVDFGQQVSARLNEVYRNELKPMPGVEDALSALDNLPRCVASNTGTDRLIYSLQMAGLYDRFQPQRVFSAAMVTSPKPAPDLFLFAAEKCGYRPSECLVIEDSAAGVTAALAAQMRVIGYAPHPSRIDYLRGAGVDADCIITDMKSLSALVQALLSELVV